MSHITRPVSDPFQYIEEDHEGIASLLERLDATTEEAEKTREELFPQLQERLTRHAEMEETLLYPVLEKIDTTHDLTMEAYEEHNVAKTLLEELSSMDVQMEEWSAKLTVLKENVEHHVEEEETEIFPKARKEVSKEERESLAKQIEEWVEKNGQ
jgi:iron-sulfur cluster repair protein YtfE (RIC family)